MAEFYAYVHARPNTVSAQGIFYVGKGSAKRVRHVGRSNRHHSNIVQKYGKDSILVGAIPCSSEDIALELEKGLIKCLKRSNVVLANRTSGGEGISGYKFSDVTRARLSELRKAENSRPERLATQKANSLKNWANSEYSSKVTEGLIKSWTSEQRRKTQSEKLRAHRLKPEEREANSRRQTECQNRPDVITKQKLARIGRIWVNDGKITRWVFSDTATQLINDGWKFGRAVSKGAI